MQWRVVEENIGYIKVMARDSGELKKGVTPRCTICRLVYREFEDGSYSWEFAPFWARIISLSPKWKHSVVDGWIPGLNPEDFDDPASRKRDIYVFKNKKPPFVYQRTPPKNRDGLDELLRSVGLEEYDTMEYMIRTPNRCGNDYFIVERDSNDDYRDFDVVGVSMNRGGVPGKAELPFDYGPQADSRFVGGALGAGGR